MNRINRICTLCLLLSSMLVVFAKQANTIKCTLKGVVIDRPQSNQLLLVKQDEDVRIKAVEIPIIDGKFEYILDCNFEEGYELIFNDEHEKGSWRAIIFFSEQCTIDFTLYPEDMFNKNVVKGGKLTKEYWDYFTPILNKYEIIDKEIHAKSEQYLEDNFGEILKKHEALEDDLMAKVEKLDKDGIDTKPVIQAITEMEQAIYQKANQEISQLTMQYIKEHPSVVGYSILLSIVQRNQYSQKKQDISPYIELYRTNFASKFSEHPYTEQMEELLKSLLVKVGSPFIDFTTNDFAGKPVTLSERIAGKPAILHLWASWCGPCRKHGKELIPIYEEFRDKGFVVIGVAREKDTSAAAKAAIEKDKYLWENLVELNDTQKIWNKYGVGNAGGEVFLIDEKGIIVAVAPSIDEIKSYLTEYYTEK